MTKAERVLALLEALQDRAFATGPELAARLGVDVRTLRRDVASLRALGIPVEGERGRGGSYRLRPGYRVPPLMFTAGEAAAVALGLMAARRLGLETDGALAKVRRVLPDRVRLPVESLEHTLGFTGTRRRGAARRRDAARAGRRRPPRPPGDRSLRGLRRRRVRARAQPVRRRRPLRAAGTCRRTTTRAASCARCARIAWRRCASAGAGEPVRAGFDAVAFVSRTLARVPWAHEVEVVLHTDLETRRAALPADARRARAA